MVAFTTQNLWNKKAFSILVFFLYVTHCNAQGNLKIIKTLTTNESQSIYCGLQDNAGNLWFGSTGQGIYRHDGKLFQQLTTKDGLNSNKVWSILEDKAGNIWIGTDSGLCRYRDGMISNIPIVVNYSASNSPYNSARNISITKNEVWSMMQDSSGKIWFGTSAGVFCYNNNSFSFFLDDKSILNRSGLSLKSVQCIVQDRKGEIWFGSGPMAFEGICRFDGKSITNYKPGGDGWIRSITEDKSGNIWFGTRHQAVWNYDGHSYMSFSEKYNLPKGGAGSLKEDNSGNIWFAYLGATPDLGVFCFDGKSTKNFTTKDGLANNSVFCILKDKAGGLWFGTAGVGLSRYDGKAFVKYSE